MVSLPLWERGLKFPYNMLETRRFAVAPPVGAWIEILLLAVPYMYRYVAPPVGAWIEILLSSCYQNEKAVAPPVGAWIEIWI